MGDSTWDDDGDHAPLPPHERTWRHPSELGTAAGAPVVPASPSHVGRGLMIVSGTLGVLLLAGLVRLLLPPDGGSQVADVSATSSNAGPVVASLASATTTTRSEPSSSTAPSGPGGTASTMPPPATVMLSAGTDRPGAIAIGVGEVLLTTAAAVGGRSELAVQLPDGEIVTATVVAIDTNTGVAVLEAETSLEPVTTAAAPSGGDQVTVLIGEGVDAKVSVDDDGVLWLRSLDDSGMVEGTPVLDGDGHLVGLCSAGAVGRARLVPVGEVDVDAIDRESVPDTATTDASRPWLGIAGTRPAEPGTTSSTPSSAASSVPGVVIAGVMDDSPAAAAGLSTGDVIVTVDDVAVSSIEDVAAAVSTHRPGDRVVLGVRTGDDPVREVPVVLGRWPVAT